MKKRLAGIIIFLMMFQMISAIGVAYGYQEDKITIASQKYKISSVEYISKVSPYQSFDLELSLEGMTKKYKLILEENSSFMSREAIDGEYKDKKYRQNDTVKIPLYYKGGEDTTLNTRFEDEDGNQIAGPPIYMDIIADTSPPPNTDSKRPNIVVSGGVDMPVVNAGEEARIRIPLENLSSVSAKDIQATLEFDADDSPFEINKLSLTYYIDRINGKKTDEAVFVVKVSDSAAEKVYTGSLKLIYYTLSGINKEQGSFTIPIRVQNSKKPAKLVLSAIGYGDTPLTAGEKRTISLILRNNGNLDARDVKISLKGLKTDGFTLHNSPDVKQVQDIPGNKVMQIDYVLIPSIAMATGNHDLQLKVDYKDGKQNSFTDEFSFFLPVKGLDTTMSDIIIENIEMPKEEIKSEESFFIAFDIVNKSDIEADEVKVSLTTDKEIICKSLNIKKLGKLVKDDKKRVEFELYATSEAVTKNYPIQINVDYENGVGEKKTKNTISQYVGVYVDRGSGKGTPRIIVDRYNIEPYTIQAGDIFQLTISLLNTSSYATVSNIKVSLVSDDGVFSPVNSSNTIYIESIGPKESMQKVFTLTPKRDAEHKTYGISVNIDYEDEKGTQLSSKDMISVPVIQQAKLVLGDVMIPPEAYVGQTFPASVEFYNMGKTTLYNLMIKTEGNFTTQNSNYYVGNFESGKTDSYEVGITPEEEGTINGKIIFSYENAVGEAFEEVKEIQANVIQMPMEPMPQPGMGENPEENEKNKIMKMVKSPYFIAGSIILAAAVVFIARKIHKKRKGMTFDE
ncbi:COG1361 S-layer family protein [Lutispora saccharofermentans]|uniref:CARDB domain-containing protein n=1 Tax=Lutispora saccharofermentans TaxID=3024236 RepID=A0ABT1NC55_9FIRM|nr:hypothetical protein [Lutispora saccharofermentans]MCQ1528214.1 hypothetical protein [Lutispora saccharofermentans]